MIVVLIYHLAACLQGMCTTCIATLLSGEIEYIEEPDPDTLTEGDIKENKILFVLLHQNQT